MRKKISPTLLAFSAIALLLLATSPMLLFFNPLLQPAQAQTSVTFKTPKPATFTDPDTGQEATLTFYAQGTTTTSGPQAAKITNGTIQVNLPGSNGNGPTQTLTGNITSGAYITSRSPPGIQFYATIQNADFLVESACTTSAGNPIEVNPGDSSGGTFNGGVFSGAVECSPSPSSSSQGEGNTTTTHATQPSSSPMTATTTQERGNSNSTDSNSGSSSSNSKDGDRDGIPDSSDRCTHNSNPKCFKEGEVSTTTTTQQQPPSSSTTRTGNQTG